MQRGAKLLLADQEINECHLAHFHDIFMDFVVVFRVFLR